MTEKETKLQSKTLKAIELVERGETPRTALQLVNMTDKISNQAVSSFKRKFKKHSLTHPKVVKQAENQIKRILSGESREVKQQKIINGQVVEYTETIAPSDTNIISAVSMVYDRYEPVIKQTVSLNIDVDPVNLDQFRNRIGASLGVSNTTDAIDVA
jgi:hypothetical protein